MRLTTNIYIYLMELAQSCNYWASWSVAWKLSYAWLMYDLEADMAAESTHTNSKLKSKTRTWEKQPISEGKLVETRVQLTAGPHQLESRVLWTCTEYNRLKLDQKECE